MNYDTRLRFTLRLNDYLANKLFEESKKKGVTRNALISEILWKYFENKTEAKH